MALGLTGDLLMAPGGWGISSSARGRPQVTQLPLFVSDGKWHHICITWTTRDGMWEAFQDGEKLGTGENLAPWHPIKPGGVLILGQEQVGGHQGAGHCGLTAAQWARAMLSHGLRACVGNMASTGRDRVRMRQIPKSCLTQGWGCPCGHGVTLSLSHQLPSGAESMESILLSPHISCWVCLD